MAESIEFSPRSIEEINNSSIRVIVLAGGKGTRLHTVTEGRIPKDFVEIDRVNKIKGIDYTQSVLNSLGISDIVYSANGFLNHYQEALQGTPTRFHYQHEGDNHGTDLKKIIEEEGTEKQYLVLPIDTYFIKDDIHRMINHHKPGTITWGISPVAEETSENKYALIAGDMNTEALFSRRNTPWWKDEYKDLPMFLCSSVMMVDPMLYLKSYKLFEQLTGKTVGVDMFTDIGALLAERSRRYSNRNIEPLVRGYLFQHEIIDYGTPDRLQLIRTKLEQQPVAA